MNQNQRMSASPVEPVTTFLVRRLSAPIPAVRSFQHRYENAVPNFPAERVHELVARGAPWTDMVEFVDSVAPLGFLIYFKNDVHPVMANAGDTAHCVSYLMGNHVIAETMFRHDPRAMLYAPLRKFLWEDSAGNAWFTIDQPSTLFASLGIPEVQNVGEELDQKLTALLHFLEVPVPDPLLTAGQSERPPRERKTRNPRQSRHSGEL
jgi:uncharacterized protein (DUF302 family)